MRRRHRDHRHPPPAGLTTRHGDGLWVVRWRSQPAPYRHPDACTGRYASRVNGTERPRIVLAACTLSGVAVDPHLDPEFAELVERTRKQLAEEGVWPRREPVPPFEPIWPPELAEILLAWARDGGYAAEVAKISAEDPDLADQ